MLHCCSSISTSVHRSSAAAATMSLMAVTFGPRSRFVPERSSPQLPKAMRWRVLQDLEAQGTRAAAVVNCRLPLPVASREMMIGRRRAPP